MIAHCMFEQSGTFKHEFQKLGIEAYDYDLQDEFGETERSMMHPQYARRFIKQYILPRESDD